MENSTTCDGALLRFDAPDGGLAVELDDDGKVAYAYLRDGNAIVGDVWLYNAAETPEAVDWTDRSALPFLNPKKFCTGESVPRLTESAVVTCQWSAEGVAVTIDGVLVAVLKRGAKPGWSRLAAQPNRLAKPLDHKPSF
jgi:hypothetical protein